MIEAVRNFPCGGLSFIRWKHNSERGRSRYRPVAIKILSFVGSEGARIRSNAGLGSTFTPSGEDRSAETRFAFAARRKG
jgi:hypothetical protein